MAPDSLCRGGGNISNFVVFHGIHQGHIGNPNKILWLRRFLSEEFLNLPPGYFNGKFVADIGAGTGVTGTVNLLEMGAAHVHALDLDDSYIDTVRTILEQEPEYPGRWTLDIGNVSNLSYDDNAFGFVVCQGTLHHTQDETQGLLKIHRILRPGYKPFITLGGGSEGLIKKFFRGVLYEIYRNNPYFADIVDNHLIEKWVHEQIDWLLENIYQDNIESYDNSVVLLKSFLYR